MICATRTILVRCIELCSIQFFHYIVFANELPVQGQQSVHYVSTNSIQIDINADIKINKNTSLHTIINMTIEIYIETSINIKLFK